MPINFESLKVFLVSNSSVTSASCGVISIYGFQAFRLLRLSFHYSPLDRENFERYISRKSISSIQESDKLLSNINTDHPQFQIKVDGPQRLCQWINGWRYLRPLCTRRAADNNHILCNRAGHPFKCKATYLPSWSFAPQLNAFCAINMWKKKMRLSTLELARCDRLNKVRRQRHLNHRHLQKQLSHGPCTHPVVLSISIYYYVLFGKSSHKGPLNIGLLGCRSVTNVYAFVLAIEWVSKFLARELQLKWFAGRPLFHSTQQYQNHPLVRTVRLLAREILYWFPCGIFGIQLPTLPNGFKITKIRWNCNPI